MLRMHVFLEWNGEVKHVHESGELVLIDVESVFENMLLSQSILYASQLFICILSKTKITLVRITFRRLCKLKRNTCSDTQALEP